MQIEENEKKNKEISNGILDVMIERVTTARRKCRLAP
jgi:hypothetical protein